MAWATPIVHSVGDILTASDWNISSNDLSFLAATAGNTVATSQTTTSASYTDLSTTGPAVTLTTGANAVVVLTANISNTAISINYMAYAVSGATTAAAADARSLQFLDQATGISGIQASAVFFHTGLTAGSNTFTAKYKTTAGTATFANRSIIVFPLP